MLRYLDIDNGRGTVTRLHDTPTRALASVQGLVGLAAPRGSSRVRPSGHGRTHRQAFLTDRSITLDGEVWGSSVEASYDELDVVTAALYDALGQDCTLRWQRGTSGQELEQAVRLHGDVKVDLAGATRLLRYQAQLVAPDPRAYSQAVYTADSAPMGDTGGGFTYPSTYPASFTPGSSGQLAVDNAGSVPTPPVFTIHGEVVDPTIKLLPDGPSLVLNGTVARGSTLALDAEARTVTLNGAANRLSMLDFAASRWFDLPRGPSSVRLLAASADADAYLSVSYRHAYGG